MGRLFKSLKNNNKKTAQSNLSKSIVSLVLAFIVLISTTFCWFSLKVSYGTTQNGIRLSAENGLRVNDIDQTLQNIADNSWLLPASSVDGRNIFFPTDGKDFSSSTSTITFRSANSGDKNCNYMQYDFYLTSEENATNVYIDLKDDASYMYFHDEASKKPADRVMSKAIRAAIYYEGIKDNKPIVLNAEKKTVTTNAVEAVDRADGGCLSTAVQTSYPFNDYTYGKRPIATMNRGETRKFSLILWIEGTRPECTSEGENGIMGKKIDFNFSLTTSWDYISNIELEEPSSSTVIQSLLNAHKDYSLVLNYSNSAKGIDDYKFTMYNAKDSNNQKIANKWSVEIPASAVNDLKFQIVDSNGDVVTLEGTKYEWSRNSYGKLTVNRGSSVKYIAEGIKTFGSNDTAGYGHWYDGEIEEGGNGRDDGGDSGIDDDDW